MDFLQLIDWQNLLIASVITTVLVSAINTVNTKIHSNFLVLGIAIIVTILNTTFIKGSSFSDWQKILSSLLFTMAFAVLFYNYLGKWFVDKFFDWLRKVLTDKFTKQTPEQKP